MRRPPTPQPTPAQENSRRSAKTLPRPLTRQDLPPTLTVEQAAEILGCGRSLAYTLIRRNEFPSPVLRLGNRRYVIPTAGLLRVVGIEEHPVPGTPETTGEQNGRSPTMHLAAAAWRSTASTTTRITSTATNSSETKTDRR